MAANSQDTEPHALGGIRIWVEVAAGKRLTESVFLCAGVSLVPPVPRGEEEACSCQQHSRQ
ncbi:hypothetical protein EYF80_062302 [Liparis tanakae]|uniref:Uncharacterized protein n=1 Tax=Liparis tanakae TaxID=230148 RepID=A0A4Z2EGX0_9TELE|nr:hypothetical protein EYF80_062302 [Liparis tanakae]